MDKRDRDQQLRYVGEALDTVSRVWPYIQMARRLEKEHGDPMLSARMLTLCHRLEGLHSDMDELRDDLEVQRDLWDPYDIPGVRALAVAFQFMAPLPDGWKHAGLMKAIVDMLPPYELLSGRKTP